MASIVQTQVRCGGCNRRLADGVNEVDAGQLLIPGVSPNDARTEAQQPTEPERWARTLIAFKDAEILTTTCDELIGDQLAPNG